MYSLNPNHENLPKAIMATDRVTRTVTLLDEAMELISQVALGDFNIPFTEERSVAHFADDIAVARDALAALINRDREYRGNLERLAEARERGRRAAATSAELFTDPSAFRYMPPRCRTCGKGETFGADAQCRECQKEDEAYMARLHKVQA